MGSALTVAGGLVSLSGGLGGHPLVVAGGCLLTCVGSSLVARQATREGGLALGSAISLAAGGGLMLAGALLLAWPTPAPPPAGPWPQLLQRLGLPA